MGKALTFTWRAIFWPAIQTVSTVIVFFPGHFTGSAWVVNPARSKILLIHHPKLNMWMQPGGHADGNANLLETALRELEEESGYTCAKVVDGTIFDLDIHTYPARQKNGVLEPEHLHFDLRFLIEIDDTIPIPGSAENQTFAWLTLDEAEAVTSSTDSVLRMIEKTFALPPKKASAPCQMIA